MDIDIKLYNEAYAKFTPDFLESGGLEQYIDENNESHIRFLNQLQQHLAMINFTDKTVLELGCGAGGLCEYFSLKNASYTGVDFSNMAIALAKSYAILKGIQANFHALDATSSMSLDHKYDYIFDSHLLHCLTGENRYKYFEFLKEHMHEKSRFICETMVFQKGLKVPVGYSFDQEFVLSKEVGNQLLPYRYLGESRSLEAELESVGFKIDYFYYHSELSINPFIEYQNYPTAFLPHITRLSLVLR